LPDKHTPDHFHHDELIDVSEPPREGLVRPRHAASLLVIRGEGETLEILMGMRGAKHRFMPNRLVFPGGAVDAGDLTARCASALTPVTERALRRAANAHLAHGLGIAAARELAEETGLSLGEPAHLAGLHYLARAVTPPDNTIRFNARFLVVSAEHVSGTLGGDGELDGLRYYAMKEALELDLALPTRRMLQRLQLWLGMSEAERGGQTHFPVLRDRGWHME
jgi:8-oxo-dGTP pyrophosphatase MutT (NUDIX family)